MVCDSVLICREKKHVAQGVIEPTTFGLQTCVITNCATGKESEHLENRVMSSQDQIAVRGEKRRFLELQNVV